MTPKDLLIFGWVCLFFGWVFTLTAPFSIPAQLIAAGLCGAAAASFGRMIWLNYFTRKTDD